MTNCRARKIRAVAPTVERSLATGDGNGEQDETKEDTMNDEFTTQEEEDEEFTALNAEQGES